MLIGLKPKLIALFDGAIPHQACALALCTSDLTLLSTLTVAALGEPITAGYRRVVHVDIHQLFPGTVKEAGKWVIGQSLEMRFTNDGTSPVVLTGAAVLLRDGVAPWSVQFAVATDPLAVPPGATMRGRVNLSSERRLDWS